MFKNVNRNNLLYGIRKEMAPRAGFEPATNRLTAGCSTAELPGNDAQSLTKEPIAKQF